MTDRIRLSEEIEETRLEEALLTAQIARHDRDAVEDDLLRAQMTVVLEMHVCHRTCLEHALRWLDAPTTTGAKIDGNAPLMEEASS